MIKRLCFLLLFLAVTVRAQLPAFPGAQGSGAATPGGRGGTVILVTNLNDSGGGSLRNCVQASGPRTCVFTVSGYIPLVGRLEIDNPNITIAGQTSPNGIWFGGPSATQYIFISTHDVIIRYIGCSADNPTLPSGPSTGTGCFEIASGSNEHDIMVDHISARWWGNKGILWLSNDTGPIYNTTVQYSLIYEPNINHPVCVMVDDTGGFAPQDTNNDFHHNMLINCDHRMPLWNMKSGRWVNNIVYNYGTTNYALLTQGSASIDIINNQYKAGNLGGNTFHPFMFNTTQSDDSPTNNMGGPPSVYLSGNSGPQQTDPNGSQLALTSTGSEGGESGSPASASWLRSTQLSPPIFPIVPDSEGNLVNTIPPTVGASQVLDCHGHFVNVRNSQDTRVVNEYLTAGSGAYFNFQFSDPTISPGTACTMSLGDGIPDQWKTDNNLSTSDAGLAKRTAPNGYTYLENYMNGGATSGSGGSPPPPPPTGAPNAPSGVTATPH